MRRKFVSPEGIDLNERVVEKAVNRTAKVMRGGRRFSFSALVVAGDGNGIVGYGYGKATDVPSAVDKAKRNARKKLRRVMVADGTIPHEVMGRFGASKVKLVPAGPGTGVIAGAPVRAVLEMAGVQDILTKSYGSNNAINLVKATLDGLENVISKDEAARRRGVTIE